MPTRPSIPLALDLCKTKDFVSRSTPKETHP